MGGSVGSPDCRCRPSFTPREAPLAGKEKKKHLGSEIHLNWDLKKEKRNKPKRAILNLS